MCKFFALLLFLSTGTLAAQEKVQTGKASFYADKFEGRLTASGEIFSQTKLTAAHKTLPFGTNVKVTNLSNDKSIVVIINDRGPFVRGRIIDLSKAAAKILEFIDQGVADVVVEILEKEEEILTVIPEKTTDSIVGTSTHEFYQLKTEQFSPKGFAVQVGSFKETANLIRLADNLKIMYGAKITVQIKQVQEVNIYSLLLGPFETREKAEKFKEKVAEDYPDCFVVDYSKAEIPGVYISK